MEKTTVFEGMRLPAMSEQEFRALGVDEVAYIKSYRVEGGLAWVVHAADGTALAVQKDVAGAIYSAEAQDLGVAAVH